MDDIKCLGLQVAVEKMKSLNGDVGHKMKEGSNAR